MGGGFSIIHWIILLVVVVVVFGTAKLKNFGKDVGGAVRDFKNAVRDDEKEQRVQQNRVLDHEALDHKKTHLLTSVFIKMSNKVDWVFDFLVFDAMR